jgi:hypothetical protein
LVAGGEIEVAVDDNERVGPELRVRGNELRVCKARVRDADENELRDLDAARPEPRRNACRGGEVGRIAPILLALAALADSLVAVRPVVEAEPRRVQCPREQRELKAVDGAAQRHQHDVGGLAGAGREV